MDVGPVSEWSASFLNCHISHRIISSLLSIAMVQRQADFFYSSVDSVALLCFFPLHTPSPTEKVGPTDIGLIFYDTSDYDASSKIRVAKWIYRRSSIVMDVSEPPDYRFCYHRCCLQVLQLLLEFLQVLSRFFTTAWPWQVNMWFLSSLGALQTGQVWYLVVYCFVKSTFIAE